MAYMKVRNVYMSGTLEVLQKYQANYLFNP